MIDELSPLKTPSYVFKIAYKSTETPRTQVQPIDGCERDNYVSNSPPERQLRKHVPNFFNESLGAEKARFNIAGTTLVHDCYSHIPLPASRQEKRKVKVGVYCR